MSKILAVFGATGTQGGSVITNVLNDPEVSKMYKIRAITRDVNSENSKQLKEKVEVVQGDATDKASLETALTGVHTVFILTTPSFTPTAVDDEFAVGSTIASIAQARGVSYLIFSTLPGYTQLSNGKYARNTAFDAKHKIEQYIRSLPVPSAFVAGAWFMQNLESQPFLAPKKLEDGTYVLGRHTATKTLFPYVDAVADLGKFVATILADPKKYEGQTFCAAAGLYTLEGVAALMSKSAGKTIVAKQLPLKDFRDGLGLPEGFTDIFEDAFGFQEEFGYFGPGTKEKVEWAKGNVRGKLTTFDEFLEKHPVHLD